MKILSTTLALCLCLSLAVEAQQHLPLWQDSDAAASAAAAQPNLDLVDFRLVAFDLSALEATLSSAPQRFSAAARQRTTTLHLPTPNGGTAAFRVENAPVMAPELAARYPMLGSYKLYSLDHPSHTGRLSYSPSGISASFGTPGGEVFIDTYIDGAAALHAVYAGSDLAASFGSGAAAICGYEGHADHQHQHQIIRGMRPAEEEVGFRGPELTELDLRTYRLALACTGEFGQQFGGTLASVMAAFNTAVTRLNQIYERELGVQIQLIPGNDNLIWLNPATDPYINANNGGALLGQNTEAIAQVAGIPLTAFDVGHVFTSGCEDVGGVVSGAACTPGKARGVTCFSSNNINGIVTRIMSHEVAHQYSVSHSWSSCPGSEGQLASGAAFEPGSGTTIMSYAGACGPDNVQFGSDDYFSAGSIAQFQFFTRQGGASNCGIVEPSGNFEPVINLSYTDGFFIPISTPFELRGQAEDPDGDPMTYGWDQYDLGPSTPLGQPIGDAPLFRSFPPSTNPVRTLPLMNRIVSNTNSVTEVLPTYSRNLTFRFVVRDNHPGAGAVVWDEVKFKSTASAGPFLVMHPNTSDVEWQVGQYTEVTWDVANTDNSLVNCKFVNIKLSLDGGFTYPIILVENTPNTGTAFVTVPNNPANNARIRVEAADNIFFDISNANFRILPATEPGYTLTTTPVSSRICLPATLDINLATSAVLGFDSPISLEVVDGLPTGTVATFSAETVVPTEASTLTLDMSAVNLTGQYPITIRAVAEGADTAYRTIVLDLVSNNFSELALTAPADGTAGILFSTGFEWTGMPNADTYDFQLGTNPDFETLVASANNLSANAFTPSGLLEPNTLYFWRVRPRNVCGEGAWLPAFGFHTVNAVCNDSPATDLPINISGTGLPTVESSIFISTEGIISDVNVKDIKAVYQPVNSLRVSLISPAGTEVVLFDRNCGNTLNLRLGFDDEAPTAIACPPATNIVHRPVQPLAAFIGENTFGLWTLRTKVVAGGFGASGAVEQWKLEFCADAIPNSPSMMTNDTLFVPPAQANTITRNKLESIDVDNNEFEVTYTIVTLPAHGTLYRAGELLSVGDRFTQATINANNLSYLHSGDDAIYDGFTFVLTDGTGGYLPTQRFNIKIDENAVVSTGEATAPQRIKLFPNPTRHLLNLALSQTLEAEAYWTVHSIHGQVLRQGKLGRGEQTLSIPVSDLSGGVYFLSLQTGDALLTQKFTVQR